MKMKGVIIFLLAAGLLLGCGKSKQPAAEEAYRAKMRLVVDEAIRQTQDPLEKEEFGAGRVPQASRFFYPSRNPGCPTLRGLCEGWDAMLSTPYLFFHSTSPHQVSSDETKRQGLFKCTPLTLRTRLRQSGGRAALQGRE
jgi:hypothetical protein